MNTQTKEPEILQSKSCPVSDDSTHTQSMHAGDLQQLSNMLSEATKLEEEKLEQKRVQSMGPGDIGPPKHATSEEPYVPNTLMSQGTRNS